jgi:tetratricopeptide (TPR) repeat protein|tara:strand:+ start:1070 stop:2776 length:1707 start_codon:yes stop_codon:yes gene_type:complete
MKNLKAQYKLIIYLFIFLTTSNITLGKTLDKFSDASDVSNYFSGVLSINDNQYQKSYSYLKSLNNLEDSHYIYSQYYQYSLVALGKFKDAAKYSQKLKDKKLDNFQSNLISAVYFLENKDFKNASFYLKKLEDKNQPGTIQNLLSTSLNAWINFRNISNLSPALSLLDAIPERFKEIKKIQKTFAHCYFDSQDVDKIFKQLTSNRDISYSRYHFFHANYLISKNKVKATKEVIKSALDQFPRNLILNQLKLDLKTKQTFNNEFDCKNPADVIAEIFYVASSALASQNNYIASNFYLNLAKHLNPNFVSYNTLHANNLYFNQEYVKAKNIYIEIKKKGAAYNWHASKQIASIFIKQNKKKKATNSLKKSFKKIVDATTYEIFDYAEFLKNNEKYEESIRYYSEVLSLIETKDNFYAQVLDGRGIAYERTNQWNKAEVDLLKSLSISPDNAHTINYLAYSWIEKGINIKKSLEMLRKANRFKPNDGYIIDSLGWALFKLKNYKEAKQYLGLAIMSMASDPVVNDHFADSLWMNNDTLQARYFWNYVLKLEKTEKKLKKKIEQKLLFGLKS